MKKSFDHISNSLSGIEFYDFKKYIEAVLLSFSLPASTIKRLFLKKEKNLKNENASVYSRALFINNNTGLSQESFSEIESNLVGIYRLLILVNDQIIICKDCVTDEVIDFNPKEIANHIDFFSPLIFGRQEERDLSTTIGFAELIGRLNNSLTLDENNSSDSENEEIVDYILALIYASFLKSTFNDSNIQTFFSWVISAKDKNYNSLIAGLFGAMFENKRQGKLFANIPFLGKEFRLNNKLPNISASSFEITSRLLCYPLEFIEPEILASLIFKLTQEDESPSIYGHYTSITNISKVLNPLFVSKYEKLILENRMQKSVLLKLRKELLSLTFFDPTNGPGCFLSAALNKVIELVELIDNSVYEVQNTKINISNFVGLLDNSLSYKLTKLTLFVTYIQYLKRQNAVSESSSITSFKNLSLYQQDQLDSDWKKVCPNNGHTFIIGSPIFKGAKKISAAEKKSMQRVFKTTSLADADYSSCWLYKAANYISNTTSQSALVITNSICQGSQVKFLWERIYELSCEISFAYRSFKWKNTSQFSTGVTVIIIGLTSQKNQEEIKFLFADNKIISAGFIGPYLINSTKTIIKERTKPLSSSLPLMQKGNMPYDNQQLLLTKSEKDNLLLESPTAIKFLKRIVGSKEFIQKIERWCLWIKSEELIEANKIPAIAKRIQNVREFRSSKSDAGARRLAERPYQFREFRSTTSSTLVVPSVSSENRPYIPIGFIGPDTIISNLAFAIYDCEPWIFGLVSSRMHMVWIRTVCGNLETRLRYSSGLGYNTFPFPDISIERKNQITSLVFDIITDREQYCEKSLGDIYSNLPESLRILHSYLDDLIDSCYQNEKFFSDMDRIKILFNLYESKAKLT